MRGEGFVATLWRAQGLEVTSQASPQDLVPRELANLYLGVAVDEAIGSVVRTGGVERDSGGGAGAQGSGYPGSIP